LSKSIASLARRSALYAAPRRKWRGGLRHSSVTQSSKELSFYYEETRRGGLRQACLGETGHRDFRRGGNGALGYPTKTKGC